MRICISVTVILIILSPRLSCQEPGSGLPGILFSGLVLDSKTGVPLENTQVIINGSAYSLTDKEGKFVFLVSHHDTVMFRRLGYKQFVFCISDTLAGTDYISGIFMNADTLEIAEVIILPRPVNIKSVISEPCTPEKREIENARNNLAISAYQARVNQNRLGNPAVNYEVLKQQQREHAYTRGQVPYDRIAGLNPLILIPAVYMLMKGFPGKQPPFKPHLEDHEIFLIRERYMQSLQEKGRGD
jgi:hypothetical protein